MPRKKKQQVTLGLFHEVANEIMADPCLRQSETSTFTYWLDDGAPFVKKYGLKDYKVRLRLLYGKIELDHIGIGRNTPDLYVIGTRGGMTKYSCRDIDKFSCFRQSHFNPFPFTPTVTDGTNVGMSPKEGRHVVYCSRLTGRHLYRTTMTPRFYPVPHVTYGPNGEEGVAPLNDPGVRTISFGYCLDKLNCRVPTSRFIASLYELGWRGARLSQLVDWLDEFLGGDEVVQCVGFNNECCLVMQSKSETFSVQSSPCLDFRTGAAVLFTLSNEAKVSTDKQVITPLTPQSSITDSLNHISAALAKRREARLLDQLPLC